LICEENRHSLDAGGEVRSDALDRASWFQVEVSRQQLLEKDAQLEPGEMRPEAEVFTIAEAVPSDSVMASALALVNFLLVANILELREDLRDVDRFDIDTPALISSTSGPWPGLSRRSTRSKLPSL
jgi:hypothetical protein